MSKGEWVLQSSHWGAFRARAAGGALEVEPFPDDPAPTPLIRNLPAAVHHASRVAGPAVRRGWLEDGPGPASRGADEFVTVSESEAVELVARELRRVYSGFGPTAVYGGSYGWGSAGRFHHAPGQLHRFLNTLGGYVAGENTYSYGASEVLIPHVLGDIAMDALASPWPVVARETELILSFGGMPLKNTAIAHSGISRHTVPGHLERFLARGGDLVQIGPCRHDGLPGSRWLPIEPGTDVAVMFGMIHTLLVEGLVDRALVSDLTVGFDEFADHLLGGNKGRAFDAVWAAGVSGAPAAEIRSLARAAASRRSLVNMAWALQRAPYGEQVPWAAIALAVACGGVGLPGQGFAHGYGSSAGPGAERLGFGVPRLPQGTNPVELSIPVAQIADLLQRPGEVLEYNGRRIQFPDIRLVYWAGGNPFHHHQDLRRLRRAFARPDTVVVHDAFWTATAQHADIVLPATLTVERNDIGAARADAGVIAMKRALDPWLGARDDHAWFADVAAALDVEEQFTLGRDEATWLRCLYEDWRSSDPRIAARTPDFETFWSRGSITLEPESAPTRLEVFRTDPLAHPLSTPSGRIEIVSDTIRGFGYDDIRPHPDWHAPAGLDAARRREYGLCLLADQPATKLHSQLDMGAHSQAAKVDGRERIELNPEDARARGIEVGDVVSVVSERGELLAVATVSDALIRGVARMPTGSWYAPDDLTHGEERCLNGNPNVLTADVGTSRLAQGCTGARVLVDVSRLTTAAPPARLHAPPRLVTRSVEEA